MKKYFLSLVAIAAAMLFATSCQESLVEPQMDGTTTFTVQVPGQMGTKATPYNGNVNKLYVQVYPENVSEDLLFQPEVVDIVDGFFTVSISLIQDQRYDIIFWAQQGESYVKKGDDLRVVSMKNHHNSEEGAAFFAYLNDFVPTGTSQPVTLKRPFAQLNLGTTEASLEPNSGKVFLNRSKVKVSNVAAVFNTVTGMGEEPVVYETTLFGVPQQSTITVNNVDYKYISMDYLPIVGDDQALVTVAAEIELTNDQVISHEFTNVPVRENYRTNIVGNLISSTTDFKVEIDDKFEEDYSDNDDIISNDYYAVDNVGQAASKFGAGETHIAINHIKNGESLNIPDTSEETLYLQLPDVNAKFTVIVPAEVNKLYITVPNTDESNVGLDLIVYAPNSTVEIKDSQLNTINGTTAQNTLILNGVTVNAVVVEQGNVVVENDSAVGGIAPGEECVDASKITIYVDETIQDEIAINDSFYVVEEKEGDIKFITSVEELKHLAILVNENETDFSGETIYLLADIDLIGENWSPIGTEASNFKGIFDGGNHTIKNLNIVESEAKEGKAYIGFFGYVKDATIKNVTFENVNIYIPCLDIDHSQGHIGAVAGSIEGTSTIEDVTVKGDIKVEATVTANGASRVAVVAGGNEGGDDVTMKNVHVIAKEGSYLKANNNVGALAGQLQGRSVFENCSSNIDVTGTKFFAGGIIGLAAGDQLFTNCHTTGNITITAGREGRNHDQYRVGGIAGGWADGATKVCTLDNCSYKGEISGTNSDGSVANPLDYAGYVGRGYTLNGCQGSKVIINGVEYVQAFNTAAEAGIYYINGELIINSAAQLKIIADMVNNGTNYFDGITIKLGADIDLKNEEWIPIGSAIKDHGFMGNFDGNGYTIKNLKITDTKLTPDSENYVYAGLFGVTEGTDAENQNYIKNLVIENVTIETTGHIAAAAIAYPYYTQVENITVKGNISIKGGDYTSGVLAYTRRCIDAKNLTITGNEGSIITGNHTVGGVISDIQMNGGLTAYYENFSAEGLRIEASMHVGGISGIIAGQTLNGAEVENVNIVCNDARRGIVSGSLGQTSIIKNVSYENVNGATSIIGASYKDNGPIFEEDGGVWKKLDIGTIVNINGIKGIIFSVEDDEIKAVSVEQGGEMTWDQSMTWAEQLGEGWKLASLDELKAIYNVRVDLNKALVKENAENILFEEDNKEEDGTYAAYWSSTLVESSTSTMPKAYYMYFDATGRETTSFTMFPVEYSRAVYVF